MKKLILLAIIAFAGLFSSSLWAEYEPTLKENNVIVKIVRLFAGQSKSTQERLLIVIRDFSEKSSNKESKRIFDVLLQRIDALRKTGEVGLGGLYHEKDGGIYYGIHHMQGVDIGSFVVLSENYAKDGNFVYYAGKIVNGADVETFSVGGVTFDFDAKDKDFLYLNGKAVRNISSNYLYAMSHAIELYVVDHGAYPQGTYQLHDLHERFLVDYLESDRGGMGITAFYRDENGRLHKTSLPLYHFNGKKGFLAVPDGTKQYTSSAYVLDVDDPKAVDGWFVIEKSID